MKRGGSGMGYTDQFNLLSPCYKNGEQPAGWHMGGVKTKTKPKKGKTTKSVKGKTPKKKTGKTKQKGGSTCYASPSVSEMGVHDKPASLEPTASERAWNNRMTGGEPGNNGIPIGNNGKPKQASISTNTNNLFQISSPAVGNLPTNGNSKKNSPLNKIKNDLLPEGTSSGLAMTIIQTSKNNKNSKYSFEIIYKTDGDSEIKKSVKSNVTFLDFLGEYRTISGKVFPKPANRPANKPANKPANANTTGLTNTSGTIQTNLTGLTNTSGTIQTNATGLINKNRNKPINITGTS
jgi:hypothetical protein